MINLQLIYYRLRCSVARPPKFYGLPKLHKPHILMRSTVSFCGSPTYELSKHLTTILQPLTNRSQHKLQSTEYFIHAIKTGQIPDDYKLVCFDVRSLFTSVPPKLDCTKTVIDRSTDELLLSTDDIMELVTLCFTSTYFQYNSKHYKQLHRTAMGFSNLCCGCWNCDAIHRVTSPCHLPTNITLLVSLSWRHHHCTTIGRYWEFPEPH